MSPFGPRRRNTIYELRASIVAVEKLAARGISVDEAEELPRIATECGQRIDEVISDLLRAIKVHAA
jgi:hypothetical protein